MSFDRLCSSCGKTFKTNEFSANCCVDCGIKKRRATDGHDSVVEFTSTHTKFPGNYEHVFDKLSGMSYYNRANTYWKTRTDEIFSSEQEFIDYLKDNGHINIQSKGVSQLSNETTEQAFTQRTREPKEITLYFWEKGHTVTLEANDPIVLRNGRKLPVKDIMIGDKIKFSDGTHQQITRTEKIYD